MVGHMTQRVQPSGTDTRAMTRVLFICAKNRLRSPTAEHVFASYPGVETDSAGVNHDAEVPVAAEQLRWADVVVVMESRHQEKLRRGFGDALKGKRVVCLDIPDDYDYMDSELVALLNQRASRFLAGR
jgi:predicted protein tyrosine phosphatase